jgi:hypothetical protein
MILNKIIFYNKNKNVYNFKYKKMELEKEKIELKKEENYRQKSLYDILHPRKPKNHYISKYYLFNTFDYIFCKNFKEDIIKKKYNKKKI